MRTTLTLDEDVATKLRVKARRSGRPFREVVNEAIRLGLARRSTAESAEPFRIEPRDLGNLRSSVKLDNIGELLEQIEGAGHR